MKSASNKVLMLLSSTPGVSERTRGAIQTELKRRNRANYGYELAKMFGEIPPPSNKPSVGNEFAQFIPRRHRHMWAPGVSAYMTRSTPIQKMNPTKTMKRRTGRSHVELDDVNPKAYKNTAWRFYAFPLQGGNFRHALFYASRNSDPFLINKKTGRRRYVRMGIVNGGVGNLIPRKNMVHTWNAYMNRATQAKKQITLLRKANDYATGRTNRGKLTNSQMRYYFLEHPRPRDMNARNVDNLRNKMRRTIQRNIETYLPGRTNMKDILNAKNMNTLVKRMKEYNSRVGPLDFAGTNMWRWKMFMRTALTRNKNSIYTI